MPFEGDLIAEPAPDERGLCMLQALPPECAWLGGLGHPLKPDWKVEVKRLNSSYSKVLGARTEWIKYLHREDVRQLWHLEAAEDAVAFCSVAAVPKRTGRMRRKILMVCPWNAALRTLTEVLGEEPPYGMQAGAALAQARLVHGLLAVGVIHKAR